MAGLLDIPEILAASGESNDLTSALPSGVAPGVSNGVPTDVWDRSASQPVWVAPTAPRIHDIASSSVQDGAAGTGARALLVIGLIAGFVVASETVVLNGTTNVPTANAYLRIPTMRCVRPFGSSGTNAGTITATAQIDVTVTAQIAPGSGAMMASIFTTPAGITGMIDVGFCGFLRPSAGITGANARMDFMARLDAGQTDSGWFIVHGIMLNINGTSYVSHRFRPNLPVPPETDIKMRATIDTNMDATVSGGFGIYLARI